MSSRSIEARLVISGEDRGASASILSVVKSVKQLEEAAKVSKPLQDVAASLQHIERAQRAVTSALSARTGFAQAEAGLKTTQSAAQAAAVALDQARKARAAFEGVKATKGSEEARQIEAATKAVRELTGAHQRAVGEVRKATAAVAAETATLQRAEAAAVKLGADLGNLEGHQQRLRTSAEGATNALRAQVRVEEQAARAAAHHAREQVEAARHMRTHGAVGLATSAAAGYVSAHSVAHGTKDAIRAGARYQHEVVALRNAGRTPEEMREISHASDATVRAVPTATFEENLKVINETTGAFGSLHHAIENLTFMQKSASALHASAGDKIHDGAGELGNKLARFFEMRGTAGNTEVFQREAGEMIRAMIFTRGNFNPHEMINFAQQAKSSLPLYSERFMSKIAPSLVTEYGGERAGTGANAFRNIIMGKANDQKQAEEWVRLGLLDKSMARMKGGHVVSWKAGAIKDTNLALSDPLEWTEKVLIPALKAKGIDTDDKLELSKALGTMFRNSNSNMFAEALAQKLSRTRLHKDEENINKAGTLDEVYQRNQKEDPTEGIKAVKAGIEDLMTAASSPLMPAAAAALKSLAEGLQSLAVSAKDHPYLAAGAGVGAAAGGFAASGYMAYKLATGFGLPAAAGELTVAAKALDAAAIKLGSPGPKDLVKDGATAAAGGAGATFGLGGITIAGGAVAGAYLDTNFGGNTGALGLLTGQESDAAKSARFKAEQDAERQRGALFGERANVLDNLQREREVRDNLAKPDAPGLLSQGLDALGYTSAEERQKRRDTLKAESEKTIAQMEAQLAAIDAKIKAAAAMPLPPVRPPDLSQVEAKATETGQRAGQSIADGVKEKAPEVQERGLTIFQRLKETFSQGIFVPINFTMGGAGGEGGGVQSASFGGGGLGGLIQRASLGGGGGGSGGGGGGGGGPSGPMPAIPSSVPMSESERNELGLITKYEAGGRNVPNYINDRTHTAQGYYQITNTNWRRLAPRLGITARNAMAASLEDQTRVALALRRESGMGNWTRYNPRLRGALGRGEQVPVPQGSSLEIPEPPAGGFGGSGGRGDLRAAAERMHQVADRMEGMGFHGQVQVALSGPGAGGARVTGIKARGRGGMTADMGVSMPGAKDDPSDWV